MTPPEALRKAAEIAVHLHWEAFLERFPEHETSTDDTHEYADFRNDEASYCTCRRLEVEAESCPQ